MSVKPAVNKNFCTTQVKKIVSGVRDSLQNLAENVCLAYLDEPVVIKQFKTIMPAVYGAAASTGKPVSKTIEDSYFKTLSSQIDNTIDTFLSKNTITEQTLFAFQQSILSVFVNSELFIYCDSINSIDKLKKKVKKIDD
jgi:hypothetical protein